MHRCSPKNQNHGLGRIWLALHGVRESGLHIDTFSARRGEAWCVFGENRSGTGVLVDMLVRDQAGEPRFFPDGGRLAHLSFAHQQALYERELRRDDTDFLDRIDPGTTVRQFIGAAKDGMALSKWFGLGSLLDSGYRQLSSGESRKLLLLTAIGGGADCLVLENPFDGLDVAARGDLASIFSDLAASGIGMLVMLSSRSDIGDWCSHLALMEGGAITACSERDAVLKTLHLRSAGKAWELSPERPKASPGESEEELVRLVQGHARYGERLIFDKLSLTIRTGSHTLVTGANGAGKSTLLALITGDHPDCYTNELYLFGKRRGSGESIWQIKQEMGIVSPALHRDYLVPGSALQAVTSGFFDSIGLYRKASGSQLASARRWLEAIGLADRATVSFRTLSFAEQRLTLIARALIKTPKLLILDEPTQGLDDANRTRLLDFLEHTAARQGSTIIFVSHRQDEYRPFFAQRIEMTPQPQTTSTPGESCPST
jgi:molybdate transport system ATP-binding protein